MIVKIRRNKLSILTKISKFILELKVGIRPLLWNNLKNFFLFLFKVINNSVLTSNFIRSSHALKICQFFNFWLFKRCLFKLDHFSNIWVGRRWRRGRWFDRLLYIRRNWPFFLLIDLDLYYIIFLWWYALNLIKVCLFASTHCVLGLPYFYVFCLDLPYVDRNLFLPFDWARVFFSDFFADSKIFLLDHDMWSTFRKIWGAL